MHTVSLIGLAILSVMAKNSTDCAIFLAAMFVVLALPKKRVADTGGEGS